MRYVVKILSEFPTTAQYSLGGKELVFNVLVKDEDGGVSEHKVRDLLHSDVLGVGIHDDHITCAVVELSRKKTLLHRYVRSVKFIKGLPELRILDLKEDTLTIGRDNSFKRDGNNAIAISTSGELITAFGSHGGVVLRYATMRSYPSVHTLYDLLCDLCVECDCNLLAYKYIRLYSELRSYTLTIQLDDSADAQRYFAKMYIDALRGGSR